MLIEIPVVLTLGLEGEIEMRSFLLLESSGGRKPAFRLQILIFFFNAKHFLKGIRELFGSSVKRTENMKKKRKWQF